MSGILVGGWGFPAASGSEGDKAQASGGSTYERGGQRPNYRGRDYIWTRVDVVRKENEITNSAGHLSLSTLAQHCLPRAILFARYWHGRRDAILRLENLVDYQRISG